MKDFLLSGRRYNGPTSPEDRPLHTEYHRALCEITREDPRYKREAYDFVLRALDRTIHDLERHTRTGADKHVSPVELLDGVRDLAGREFGLLARAVLESWGVFQTEDIGEIVFNLVDHRLLNKQDSDSRADFREGFDFAEVFERDYDIPLTGDLIGDA